MISSPVALSAQRLSEPATTARALRKIAEILGHRLDSLHEFTLRKLCTEIKAALQQCLLCGRSIRPMLGPTAALTSISPA
jgi:hypothetical protein